MTLLERLRSSSPWRRDDDDEGIALLMVVGYMVVFALLMLIMLGIVVNQVRPTAQARKDSGALNAAATGLQGGLALLRSAEDQWGNGDRASLPCTAGATTTFQQGSSIVHTAGTVLGASNGVTAADVPGSFTYRVSVAYYRSDPTGQSTAWLSSSANLIGCPLTETPLYAYLQSYGMGANIAGAGGSTGNRGNRSQTGVYRFAVPQANIAGGHLPLFGTTLCLDAGPTPAVGTGLTFQTCTSPITAAQTFAYRSDLTLFYGGNPALDLCVEGSTTEAVTLRRCTGTGDGSTYPFDAGQQVQEWSYNDNGHFAAAANNGGVTNQCLQPSSIAAGATPQVTSCNNSITDPTGFAPDASVGAGKAGGNTSGAPGSPTNQFVNFAEFGRCLDITGQNVNASSLILYPCKQAPDSTTLSFNQVWSLSTGVGVPGQLSVTKSATKYCLTAPATGTYVTTTACSAARTDQLWTAKGSVAGSDSTSYTVVSTTRPGMCLSTSRTNMPNAPWSVITVENCNGTTRQRWNAPPASPLSGLDSIAEGSTAP